MDSRGDTTPDLVITDDKINGYLLNVDHIEGGPKARFFIARGFDAEKTEPFLSALFDHARPSRRVAEIETGFGIKTVYEGPLTTPDGTNPQVRSVWHKATGDFRHLLVTAYPF